MNYILPCAPSYKCCDRFSVCPDAVEDEEGNVSFWPILEALLARPVSSGADLVDILETVAYTLRNECIRDFELLREQLDSRPDFWTECWPVLRDVALRMPALFPRGSLPVLGRTETFHLTFSRAETACLVVHQFLCTLQAPVWREDGIDFRIWYSANQRHPTAVSLYLDALFSYFQDLPGAPLMLDVSPREWCIRYELHVGHANAAKSRSDYSALSPASVEFVNRHDMSPSSLGLPGGACVISANKYIGFGQSATQEEVHVGVSPEACPAVLFTPPLLDNHALVVTGAQAYSNLSGTRRDIRKEDMPPPSNGDTTVWRNRTMLFMDALEIDMMSSESGLADLVPANVEREIEKAFIAFSPLPGGNQYRGIHTGLWGCGAFFADPGIKMLCLWCAASVANQPLTIICDAEQHDFGRQLLRFFATAGSAALTVGDLRYLLGAAPPGLQRHATLAWFLDNLK